MKSLYHLTRTAEYLMRSNVLYWQGIHQLLNMIGWQDLGIYFLEHGRRQDLIDALGEVESTKLKNNISQLTTEFDDFWDKATLLSAIILPRLKVKDGRPHLAQCFNDFNSDEKFSSSESQD